MRKVKFAFWIIILALFSVLVFQNLEYFITENSLILNLYFYNRETVPVYNLVIIVAFFAFGLLISYTSSLLDRFRANRTIKELRAKVKSLQGALDQVKKDVEILKTPFSPEEEVGTSYQAKKDDQGDSSEVQTA